MDPFAEPAPVEPADHVLPDALRGDDAILLVMDVDSTLIQDEVIELLAEHAGTRAEVAAVTESAMRGELDFAQSLHARVATLAGLPVSVVEDVRAAVRLSPGARTLVSTFRAKGWPVAVVSGGFHEVVDPLADAVGIPFTRANTLETQDGRLTGRVTGAVVDRAAKARFLQQVAADEGIPLARTVAVGDGANDLDMMGVAGLGIAYCAKPATRERADVSITVPRLDLVLQVLGIEPQVQADDDGGYPLAGSPLG